MTEARALPEPVNIALPPADVALGWARMGFPVFPCAPDKSPLTPHGFKDASADLGRVAAMWRAHPTALVGLPTGDASGLFVIDLDTDKTTGEALGEATLARLGFPELWRSVPSVRTPSGGRHLYFRPPGLGNTAKRLGAGIDTRGNGGYVIAAGSVGPAGAYVAQGGPMMRRETLPALPVPLLDALRGNPVPARPSFQIDTGARFSASEASRAEVEEILSYIPASCGYADWVAVLMGLHDQFGGSPEGLDLADRWSATGGPKYRPGEVAAKWRGFTLGGGTGWQSVCALARQNGADLSDIARRHKGHGTASLPPKAPSLPAADPAKPPAERRQSRAKWCADLACTVLETDPAWEGVLAYDEFTGLNMLLQPIPGSPVPKSTFKPRPICDTDFTAAVRWFNRNGYPDATRNTVTDAVYLVAAQTVLSPVRHYLEGLQWDGTPRVQDWLITYCGAEPSELTRKVGQAWLVSAVARTFQPGCKADCALILEGRQGAGKSSLLRVLAGESWFHDGLSDMHGKDASAALKGKWIVELPELSAVRRSDTEAVKAFLSRAEERYRPAYGRAEVVEPRRCVFAGTTNRSDYLTDDTGGRRFWPVTVGAVRIADLARDRDQIWAEAVSLYRSGAQWWLDRDAEQAAAAVVSDRSADDPWAADVLTAVAGLSEVGTRDVLQRMDIPRERWTKADGMRIAGILTRAGWSRAGKFTGGINRDLARYVPPTGGGHE